MGVGRGVEDALYTNALISCNTNVKDTYIRNIYKFYETPVDYLSALTLPRYSSRTRSCMILSHEIFCFSHICFSHFYPLKTVVMQPTELKTQILNCITQNRL